MGLLRNALISVLVLYAAYSYNSGSKPKPESPVVSTSYGELRGVVSVSRDGRDFYEFLGLKYAKSERFMSPEKPDSWPGIKVAKDYGDKCIHVDLLAGNLHGKEDCLFLNVFTPKLPTETEKVRYPVMLFIHGGHYTEGAADGHRPEFFMDEEVVLVTINYRLGALGFLNTNDGTVRGNMGLKDQTMALKWVHENIQNFGGDPKNVVIFGESAGSTAVHYHVLSPASKGLFSKAISQSGVALNVWAQMKAPEKQAKRLAKILNCPVDDMPKMVDCLKAKPAEEIVLVHREILDPLRDPLTVFVPSVEVIQDEESFLVETPEAIMQKGNFNGVPWLTGINSEEGLIVSSTIMRNDTLRKLGQSHWELNAPKFLYYERDDEISQKIRDFYFGKDPGMDAEAEYARYTALLGDRHFFVGVKEAIELHARAAPAYIYYYTYPGEFTLTHILLAVKGRFPVMVELVSHFVLTWLKQAVLGISPPRYGICHADELSLFFPIPGLTDVPVGHRDYAMSKEVLRLWVDFAKNEKTMEFKGLKWGPVQPGKDLEYLKIDTESGFVGQPYQDRIDFWQSLKLKERKN